MGYMEYRGFTFARSEFVSCRATDSDYIDIRFSAKDKYVSAKRVEIRIGSVWAELCTVTFFSGNEYAVGLCRSLGYDDGKIEMKMSFIAGVVGSCAPGSKPIEGCTFTETELCLSVVLTCQNFDRERKVRLVDGWRENEGGVEIYFDRSWNVMCNEKWEISDANVVCRQLGYQKAVAVSAKRRSLYSLNDNNNTKSYTLCRSETLFKDCVKQRSPSCKEAEVTCKEEDCKCF